MKKILIAFIASVALVLGTGAFVSGASAADYPSSVPTKPQATKSVKKVKAGHKFKLTVKVKAGNAKVNGTLIVKFNGKTYKVKVKNGVAKFTARAPKKTGTKTIKYTFKPSKGSVYKKSSGKSKIKIRK
jgi:hypothetical protein